MHPLSPLTFYFIFLHTDLILIYTPGRMWLSIPSACRPLCGRIHHNLPTLKSLRNRGRERENGSWTRLGSDRVTKRNSGGRPQYSCVLDDSRLSAILEKFEPVYNSRPHYRVSQSIGKEAKSTLVLWGWRIKEKRNAFNTKLTRR